MHAPHSAAPCGTALDAGLIDVRSVAALCGCSTRHVRRLTDAGRMPAPVRLGSLLRWRRADIDAWIADGCPAVRRPTATRP